MHCPHNEPQRCWARLCFMKGPHSYFSSIWHLHWLFPGHWLFCHSLGVDASIPWAQMKPHWWINHLSGQHERRAQFANWGCSCKRNWILISCCRGHILSLQPESQPRFTFLTHLLAWASPFGEEPVRAHSKLITEASKQKAMCETPMITNGKWGQLNPL